MSARCPASKALRHTGFTLIEVLVVIMIFLVLASILMTVQKTSLLNANSAKSIGNLRQIGAALHQYIGDHDGYLPAMSALADPKNPGGNVLTAQRLLAPYTGLSDNLSWNSNSNTAQVYGVWICPTDTEPRNRPGPDLARWKAMNSYLVNYYVGKGPVDEGGNNANLRTIEKIVQTDKAASLWYFADGIATAGGQGRMSVGMINAGENQSGALQLRFRHKNKIHVLHLSGSVSAYSPEDLAGQGENFLNPK